MPDPSISSGLKVKNKMIKVLLDSGSSGDLLFMKKGSSKHIIRDNRSHLTASGREKLLSVLLKFELLFNGTLSDWKLLPVSFELKEGMKPYNGRPYPILHKHKAILI
jgi:hypothetical protein